MRKNFFLLYAAALLTSVTFLACNNEDEKKPTAETMTTPMEETKTETPNDVVDIAIASPDHSTLVAAVKAAGLVETLKGTGPFTLFAPSNAAFAALPAGTVDALLTAEKKTELTKILTFHVVAGTVKAADLTDGQKIKTLEGGELTVSVKDGKVMINGANVTAADLEGSNGVVHVIDTVLLPAN